METAVTTSFGSLNPAQRTAAEYPCDSQAVSGATDVPGALLIIAGAGSGKTNTLAHRVAHLLVNDIDPQRILLLTFTRRAAAEMTRRARRICEQRFAEEARLTPRQLEARVAEGVPQLLAPGDDTVLPLTHGGAGGPQAQTRSLGIELPTTFASATFASATAPTTFAPATAPTTFTSATAPTTFASATAPTTFASATAPATFAPATAPATFASATAPTIFASATGPGAMPATALGGSSRVRTAELHWSGTFHAVANRLLRIHAHSLSLDPAFTLLDRSDAADLMNLRRNDLGLAKRKTRFPKKSTCLSIYSHVVNAQCSVAEALEKAFPWCSNWEKELRELFAAYVASKQEHNVLDYDDLLLYWYYLMEEPELARSVVERFDHVLVDEYQDTNALQASILLRLRPQGTGLTVVGDDAQSIYSFRAANVRNILDFPNQFERKTAVLTLEQNYRSTQPILNACNAVIERSKERFTKNLFSDRVSHQRPRLVSVEDEAGQVEYVVEQILARREEGIALKQQAVLIRTSHHSDALEVELGRRNIPFVKFGGLKFLESAHVKDVICVLRWAENPTDALAAFRVTQLLPGVGPATAGRVIETHAAQAFDFARLGEIAVPAAAAADWPGLCELMNLLRNGQTGWTGQLAMVRRWYTPHLERVYDAAVVRAGDIEQLEQISGEYPSRERFLSELTLDPPSSTGDLAGPPLLDEDYLILSTIHSAKGQEWDAVYILNVADGCIPSDMATDSPEQIEEERRLLYVAMTRARDHLDLVHPLRFYRHQQHRHGDAHMFSPRTRFIPDDMLEYFERHTHGRAQPRDGSGKPVTAARIDVRARAQARWA
ncbi:MAG: DNA helicase-2/ATP-dependent DNA helicase PcrA [Myxococcota bacterium]